MIQLVVISPFLNYGIGDLITDPATVAAILAGPFRADVVETQGGGPSGPETLSVQVVTAVVGAPLVLSGTVANAAPTALDYSANNGATWTAIAGYALAGIDWTGFGPTYASAQSGSLLVRDHNAPTVVSVPASFTVAAAPGGGGGSNSGTLMLGDGSVIDAIGAGLVAPTAAGPLSVAFGTIAGTVADGGALTAEAAARAAGDALNAAAAAAAQATASEAVPVGLIGAADGVAPLDGNGLVPMARVPAIVGQAWADEAASAAIFHRGPVPQPAAPRSGLLFGDRLKIAGEFNFGEIWDTQATYDAWPALQNFLLYCQLMALAMKTDGIDNLTERNCVRAILPRGAYLVSQPLIVPEYVELDCRGTLYRAAYTTDQSNNGTTSVPGPFATNQFLPTVVVAPRAHAKNLNIYVNTDGNIAHRGSGVCIGKTWAAQIGQPCTIGNPGSGYAVGDLLFMAQPSAGPYFNWAAQVTSISGGGSTGPIASAVVHAAGAYALPPSTYNGGPSLQQQQWTAANGFAGIFDTANPGCFTVHSAYESNATTPSAGTGATLAPTWCADYVSGTAAYNIGSAITNGSQIGKIQVTGGIPVVIDTIHGPSFGVMVTGLETVIDEIQVLGGNAGVFGYFAQDVRIGVLNVVEGGVGVELFGCGSWHCPLVVLDTCGSAFLINESQGVRFLFRAFFEQDNIGIPNAYPNSLGNAIQIGNASSSTFPCSDIRLEGELVNMGGLPQSTINANPGTAVGGQTPRPMAASIFLAWLFSSVLRVKVTNTGEQGGAPSILPSSGFCKFGFGVDAGNVIEGVIDTVPTIDGTAPPAQLITLTSGHGYPNCAIRVWDGLHQAWLGPGGVCEIFGSAAPASGSSGAGAGFAAPGSVFVNTASGAGERWVNAGSLFSPSWSALNGSSSGTATYSGGTNIAVVSDVISLAAPASAALLATNSGGSLTALALGAGLSSSGGTLSATISSNGTLTLADGSVIAGLGGGLTVSSGLLKSNFGTVTGSVADGGLLAAAASSAASAAATANAALPKAAVPAGAALLSTTSGGTLQAVTLGTNLLIGAGNVLNAASAGSAVASFNGRAGAIVLAQSDVTKALPVMAAGAFFDGNSHPVSSVLGVSTWAGLIAYDSGQYAFLANAYNGLVFTDTTTQAPIAAGATQITFGGPASFQGYVSGATLTVTAISQGGLFIGQTIMLPTETWTYGGQTFIDDVSTIGTIAALGTGAGGAGTYTLAASAPTEGSSGAPVAFIGSVNPRFVPVPRAGQMVSGTGIAAGCTVSAVSVLPDPSYTITLSAATTATIPFGETITFHISDADAGALEMDWLALMSVANAVNQSVAPGAEEVTAIELPDGTARMGKYEWVIPQSNYGQNTAGYPPISRIFGRGPVSTVLRWDGDVGAGRYLMRPPAELVSQVRSYWSDFALLMGTTIATTGYGVVPNYACGILCTASSLYARLTVSEVWAGFYVGVDHCTFDYIQASNNWFGWYAGYCGGDYGNHVFNNTSAGGTYRAGWGAAWNNGWWNCQFKQTNCTNGPFHHFRELVTPGNYGGNSPWLPSCTWYDATAEALGNANFYGATAAAAFAAGRFAGGNDSIVQCQWVGNCGGSTDEGGAADHSDPNIASPGLFVVSELSQNDFGGIDVFLDNGADFSHPGYSAIFCVTGFAAGNDFGPAGAFLTSGQAVNTISGVISGTAFSLAAGTVAKGMVLGGPGVQHGTYITGGSGAAWTVNQTHSTTGTATTAGVIGFFNANGGQFIVSNDNIWSNGSTEGFFAHWLDTASPGADAVAGQLVQPQGLGVVTNPAAGNVLGGVALAGSVGWNPMAIVTRGPVSINKDGGVTFGLASPVYVSATSKTNCGSAASGQPIAAVIQDGAGSVQAWLNAPTVVL